MRQFLNSHHVKYNDCMNSIITHATKAHKKVAYNHANQRKKKRKCG